MKLKGLPTKRLLTQYSAIMRELKHRRVVRSTNNPVADYAETLAAKAFNLTLASKSTKGYDAEDSKGKRYEIKGRRPTPENKSRQLSVIRELPKHHFHYLLGVVFDEDFTVKRACRMTAKAVERLAVHRSYVNGWIVQLRDEVWDLRGVEDVTQQLRAAQKE